MIERLPHWNLVNNYPAFHDVESKTAIEMVARVYGKMNELVDDYNKYVDEINKAIDDFENGITADYETFTTNITKIVHDYIAMIDEKIVVQDTKIEESIVYIKNNIQESANTIIHEMVETGELTLTNIYDEENKKLTLQLGGDM